VLGTPLSVTAAGGLLVAGMGLLLTVRGGRPRLDAAPSEEPQIQSGYVGSGSGPVDWSRVCSSARPTA
jgi:hypothetical protein